MFACSMVFVLVGPSFRGCPIWSILHYIILPGWLNFLYFYNSPSFLMVQEWKFINAIGGIKEGSKMKFNGNKYKSGYKSTIFFAKLGFVYKETTHMHVCMYIA